MLRQVPGASGIARGRRTVLLGLAAVLSMTSVAMAARTVRFDGAPGTGVPPKRMDGLPMRKFRRDHRRNRAAVRSVAAPRGRVRFSKVLVHFTVRSRPMHWGTWSHSYHGDVYYVATSVTLRLPRGTTRFYFYAEPNDSTPQHRTFAVTASTAGASSGPVQVAGDGGARFFGFAAKGGAVLRTITISSDDKRIRTQSGDYVQIGGFAIGEFGIHRRR